MPRAHHRQQHRNRDAHGPVHRDALYEKARSGTKVSIDATITRGTSSFGAKIPEAKLEPKGLKKQSGQAITQEFAFDGIVASDVDSPVKFTLTNSVPSHDA